MNKDIDIIKERWKNFEQRRAETIHNFGKIVDSKFDNKNNIKSYSIEVYDYDFKDKRNNFKINKIAINFKIFADNGKLKVESIKILDYNKNFEMLSFQGKLYNLVNRNIDKFSNSSKFARIYEEDSIITLISFTTYGLCGTAISPLGIGLKFNQDEGKFIISNTSYDFGVWFQPRIIADSFEKALLNNLDEELDFTDINKVNEYLVKLNNKIVEGCLFSFPEKLNEINISILLNNYNNIKNILENSL